MDRLNRAAMGATSSYHSLNWLRNVEPNCQVIRT